MKSVKTEDVFQKSYNKYPNKPFRILLGMYKGSYHKLIMATLCYIVKHSPVWIMPIVTANIINTVTGQVANSSDIILNNAIVIAVLILFNIPTNYLHVHFRSSSFRSVEAGLRSALVRKIQQLSIPYHKEMQSGRLQSKIIRDVEAVETLSSQMFVSFLNIIINIAVALAVTAFKNKVVFVFFLLTVPVAAITIVVFRNRIKEQNHKFRNKIEDTSARVMEMVDMIPVTRAHGLEDIEVKNMDIQVSQVAEEGYRLDIIQANFGAVSWAVFQLFQVFCLVFTGILALRGRIPAGDIVLYQTYFASVVNQVSSLVTLFPTMSKGMESINSIGEILNVHDVEDHTGLKIDDLLGNYEFNNVSFAYDKKHPILQGLNMKVNQGETIAIVGESGAGKSTILNMVIGFILPNEGDLLIDGHNIKEIDLHHYRKHISVVPQESILFSGSIRDNITYGLTNVTERELEEAIEAASLRDLIDSLPEGLDTNIGEHGDKLSGGQRQRISIARALIRDPKIIIFDEATSALDSVSEKQILNALENLAKGRTTFVVAHRLSTIKKADKIAVIKNGVCSEIGTYDELIALKGEFYKMKVIQS